MHSGKTANTGTTLEPTIDRSQSENAIHYTTDALQLRSSELTFRLESLMIIRVKTLF